MMPELSLHILDIAQNALDAGAGFLCVDLWQRACADCLSITLSDDGRGMTPEQAARAASPFFTTRPGRSTGLGLSFLRQAAELTGGSLTLSSRPGAGATVTARFGLSHIDRMPLGDMTGTLLALLAPNPGLALRLTCDADRGGYSADTRALPDRRPDRLFRIVREMGEGIARCGIR